MKLCIAEKPSVAKDLANILGATTRHDGYFEGNGYMVSWTFGHLCTLKEPQDYKDHWKYWKIEDLPIFPDRFGIKIKNNQGVQKQFELITKLVAKAKEVINCGDAGQEGELIQRWVLIKANCQVPVKRLGFLHLQKKLLKKVLKSLRTPQNMIIFSLQVTHERSETGYLESMARVYTLRNLARIKPRYPLDVYKLRR